MDIIKQQNSIIGLALGDAWGASTEFFPFEDMQGAYYTAENPHELLDGKFQKDLSVTDDTHMSIHVFRALNAIVENDLLPDNGSYKDIPKGLQIQHERMFLKEFLAWYESPLNTYQRAPGNTCMQSLMLFSQANEMRTPLDSSLLSNDSMGSGTIMRSGWIGVHPGIPDDAIAYFSHLQSELTHKHPLASPPAVIHSLLIRELAKGDIELTGIIERAQELCTKLNYTDLLPYLDKCESTLHKMRENELLSYDPCSDLGGGWIAPETLALSLSIAQAYSDNPSDALRRSALTGGDSDTIGAVTGALVGAGSPHTIDEWTGLFHTVEEPFKQDLLNIMRQLT